VLRVKIGALVLALTTFAVPSLVSQKLWVGPIHFGEPQQDVEKALGAAKAVTNPEKSVLCYTDGESHTVLWFESRTGLFRIEAGEGLVKGCVALAARYRPIRLWRWAGGTVSSPPSATKLRQAGPQWVPPGTLDSFWHFRLEGCEGSLSYASFGSYSFEMGPLSCAR